MSRRAIVTGATGFIGWHLCERLRTSGWDVCAIVRRSSRRPVPPGVDRVTADLRVDELSPVVKPADVVFHLAGVTRARNDREFFAVNGDATREVALATRRAGAKLVYVSSQAAAGPGTPEAPCLETDPPQPCCAYGVSKLAGETAIKEIADLRWTILRPVAVYGPRDTDFLSLFRLAGAGLFPVVGNPVAAFMFVFIDDATAAIESAAVSGAANGGTFFVSHPVPRTFGEVAGILAASVGRSGKPFFVPRLLFRCLAEVGEFGGVVGRPGLLNRSRFREMTARGFVCSVDRARALLGFQAETDLPEGFVRTAAWYRANGWLRQPSRSTTH
jgi:nucleoside-diphosphate-sugar epimerase